MIRLRDACLAMVVTTACSPVFDPSNVPDAAIDAPDTTPPSLVSSYPANMQARVSVLTPISLFFDRRLDPATVNDTTVRIRYFDDGYAGTNYYSSYQGWRYSYVRVSYEDASNHKISIVPSQPMYLGFRYEVVVDGVKDLSGNAFTGNVTFLTYANSPKQYAGYDSNGVIAYVYRYELDENGRPDKDLYYNGAGPDATWFTPDDVLPCCPYGYRFGPDGRRLEYRSWNVGPDGLPNTADDVISYLQKFNYDPAGNLADVTTLGPGPDGLYATGDDVPTSYTGYVYMDGFNTSYATFNNPGVDGVWKTADDRAASATTTWYEHKGDTLGNRTRLIGRRVGADLLPRTADDVVFRVNDYEYDSYGYQTRFIYGATGPDNLWLTADDTISYYEHYQRDADGLLTGKWYYFSAGPDGIWLTADDPPDTYRTVYKYGPTRQVVEETYLSGPGADAMWGTPDDVVNGYTTFQVDANGNRVQHRRWNHGPDNLYKTGDDRSYETLDYEATK